MGNLNYRRSRSREYDLQHDFQKKGYLAFRTAGSHGIADVVAIRPHPGCGYPDHYEVILAQVKVSEDIKKEVQELKVEDCPFGNANVVYYKYPVKTKYWFFQDKKRKEKEKKRLKKGKKTVSKKKK